MKIYKTQEDDVTQAIINSLESETNQKIFTLRVFNEDEDEIDDVLEVLVVFEDKSILMADVFITRIDNRLAVRMRGNFI